MIRLRRHAPPSMIAGSVALVGARVISIIAGLATVSIVARALDDGSFGFWSVLISTTTLTAGLDLGIGNAVRNRIASMGAVGDEGGAGEALGAAVLVVTLLSGTLTAVVLTGAVGIQATGRADWSEEQRLAIFVAVICLGVFQVGNLGQLVLLARERPVLVATLEIARWAMTAAALLFVAMAEGGLILMTAIYFVALVLSTLAAFPLLVVNGYWKGFPSISRAWSLTREDLRANTGFASLQIVATLVNQTDVLIAAQLTSLASAGEFALVQRLYMVPLTLLFAAVTPLWARTSVEVARGNHTWVRSTGERAALVTVSLVMVGGPALAFGGPFVVKIWVGRDVGEPLLYAGLAVWLGVSAVVTVLSVILNGMGRIWPQVRWLTVAMAAKIIVASMLVGRFGVSALAWGAAFALLPLAWSNWREVRRVTLVA